MCFQAISRLLEGFEMGPNYAYIATLYIYIYMYIYTAMHRQIRLSCFFTIGKKIGQGAARPGQFFCLVVFHIWHRAYIIH